MSLVRSLRVDCKGLDHVEFTADNRYAIATCEFSGQLVKIDLATQKVVGYLTLDPDVVERFMSAPVARLFGRKGVASNGFRALMRVPSMPQDIRSSAGRPDVLRRRHEEERRVRSRSGPSSSASTSFRLESARTESFPVAMASISTSQSRLDNARRRASRTWLGLGARPGDRQRRRHLAVPGGGAPTWATSPSMGASCGSRVATTTRSTCSTPGPVKLTHRIPVGREPHGLAVWPQPGRYSLGHTGNMR